MIKRKYGMVRDRYDERDYPFTLSAIRLPPVVDLRLACSPIEDQGQLGSCTAFAIVGALEFLEMKEKKTLVKLSEMFLYYDERVIEGDVTQDAGAQIRDGVKSCAQTGVCPLADWPYTISKFKSHPPAKCYTDALVYKTGVYSRLVTLQDMQNCLAQGYPFVFGFDVYASFESSEVEKTGVVPMPKPKEAYLGGHAVLAVGYDMTSQRFIVRNSWGTAWGQKGYFTMPFAYLASTKLTSDIWTIRK